MGPSAALRNSAPPASVPASAMAAKGTTVPPGGPRGGGAGGPGREGPEPGGPGGGEARVVAATDLAGGKRSRRGAANVAQTDRAPYGSRDA